MECELFSFNEMIRRSEVLPNQSWSVRNTQNPKMLARGGRSVGLSATPLLVFKDRPAGSSLMAQYTNTTNARLHQVEKAYNSSPPKQDNRGATCKFTDFFKPLHNKNHWVIRLPKVLMEGRKLAGRESWHVHSSSAGHRLACSLTSAVHCLLYERQGRVQTSFTLRGTAEVQA